VIDDDHDRAHERARRFVGVDLVGDDRRRIRRRRGREERREYDAGQELLHHAG